MKNKKVQQICPMHMNEKVIRIASPTCRRLLTYIPFDIIAGNVDLLALSHMYTPFGPSADDDF